MNCEQAVDLLTGPATPDNSAQRRAAAVHAESCDDCRAAAMAVHSLRLASMAAVPLPDPEAFERATRSPLRLPEFRPARGSRFWLGTAVGAALAASLALAAVWLVAPPTVPDVITTPQVRMALNESREISISLDTSQALQDAEIRVRLEGGVGLVGYQGTRELQWRTNLDSGANQLRLPILASGRDGGQVMVEVIHGGKRRTFLVDVDVRETV